MHTEIVLTLTGAERIGLVEEITGRLLNLGGNVETSRMARLGGYFAVIMLVSLPSRQLAHVDREVEELIARGYQVTVSRSEPPGSLGHPGWPGYQIDVEGADHEGLIHEVSRKLAQCGINIESLDTATTPAPHSGTPLFAMKARISVPPDLPAPVWKGALKELGRQLNLAVKVTAASRAGGADRPCP